jgi:hypothetical protein
MKESNAKERAIPGVLRAGGLVLMLPGRAERQADNDIASMRISAGEKSDVCLAAAIRAY